MVPPTIRQDRVFSFLTGELGIQPMHLSPLRPGAWSAVYGFENHGKPFVIRLSEHGDDFDRDAYAIRFRSDDIPVPLITHRGVLDGYHFAVSERMPGKFIDELSAPELQSSLPSLVRLLDALRTADVSGSTGYGGWDSAGNGTSASWSEHLVTSLQDSAEARGGSWRHRLESSPTGAGAFDRDVALLEKRANDMPNLRQVIHADLLNFNLFFDHHRVSGVIDWGCAMYGDAVYELAWFAFWWPWYQQWAGLNVPEAVRRYQEEMGVDLAGFQERLLCYQLHIGLGHQSYNASIGNWDMLEAVTRHTTRIADEIR